MHLPFKQHASYLTIMWGYQPAVDNKNELVQGPHDSQALSANPGHTTGNKAENKSSFVCSCKKSVSSMLIFVEF